MIINFEENYFYSIINKDFMNQMMLNCNYRNLMKYY